MILYINILCIHAYIMYYYKLLVYYNESYYYTNLYELARGYAGPTTCLTDLCCTY